MRRTSGLLLACVVMAGSWVEAQASPTDAIAFTGVWQLVNDAGETRKRLQAIESVVAEMSVFVRGTARERLLERTAPPGELRLVVQGDRLDLSRGDGKLSLRFGAKPKTVGKNGKRGTVSARYADGRIVVASEGEGGKVVNTYSLSPDGKRLVMSVRMTGKKLPAPLAFQSSYARR
jgi:hypothetical protein